MAYNGKAYHGWQNQPNAISVQEVLEDGLSKLLQTAISVVGAGRTDTGVHALQMFAHFDSDHDFDYVRLIYKLNAFLPKDIAVINIHKVNNEAHARFDAVSRSYIYRITTQKDPFSYENAFYLKQPIDVNKLNEASKILFDYKNFKCFSRSNTDVKTYYCDINHAAWSVTSNELKFEITADRFLRNMVRAIVGTFIEIGIGKMPVEQLHKIIASENRSEAGPSAPAHGLYLKKIEYPKNIFI